MSAGPSMALEKAQRRAFPRQPISVPLDLVVLRSGVPENLPGRCTDISEAGLGAAVAGELAPGQPVAIELRLPNVGLPVRARALVRYQSRLHCGLEFVGLSAEQREMIQYWIGRPAPKPKVENEEKLSVAKPEAAAIGARQPVRTQRSIRVGRRGFYALIAGLLMLAGLVWWQWQRSWNELERRLPAAESGLRISPETMKQRIVRKIDPVYPETALMARTEGLVVLDALIAPDGSVRRLRSVSGPDPLVESATEAVRSWKFDPYIASGKAVEVETTIAVDFRLN